MPKRKNKNLKLPGKPIFFLLLAAFSVIFILNRMRVFFLSSPYFTIYRVAIEGVAPEDFIEFKKRLVGKNIFSQKLKDLKKQIEASADIECILISRRLPGELVFKLKKRIPLAQLKLTRYHLIDQSGVLIAGASDLAYENLPVILGIENKNLQGKPQQYYPGKPELSLALKLIKEKNNVSALADYRLTKLSLFNQKASSFFLAENPPQSGLGYGKPNPASPAGRHGPPDSVLLKKNTPLSQIEIKFDLERPLETMRVLGALLPKLKAAGNPLGGLSPFGGIEYIDLRNIDSPVVMEKKKNK